MRLVVCGSPCSFITPNPHAVSSPGDGGLPEACGLFRSSQSRGMLSWPSLCPVSARRIDMDWMDGPRCRHPAWTARATRHGWVPQGNPGDSAVDAHPSHAISGASRARDPDRSSTAPCARPSRGTSSPRRSRIARSHRTPQRGRRDSLAPRQLLSLAPARCFLVAAFFRARSFRPEPTFSPSK